MGALQRYDEWETALDVTSGGALDDLYDPATVRALDSGVEPATEAPQRWRSGLAAGALASGLARGMRDGIENTEQEAVVEVEHALRSAPLEPVSVYLAWGEPSAGVAVVRPWLMPAG